MIRHILGIDLGSTFTRAAVITGDRVELIPNACDGGFQFPTVGLLMPEGFRIGTDTADAQPDDEGRVIREFVRDIGNEGDTSVHGCSLSSEDLVAELLRHIRSAAATVRDINSVGLALTIPAFSGPRYRQAILRCADSAGFSPAVTELIDRPVAHGMESMYHGHVANGDCFLVYDWGGGSFSAALIQDGRVLASDELPFHGGRDIDRLIFDDLLATCLPEMRDELTAGATPVISLVQQQLQRQIQSLKHQLSTYESGELLLLSPSAQLIRYSLDRARLEDLSRPLVGLTVELCRDLIDDSGVKPVAIVTVGGSSRMPQVRATLEQQLSEPVVSPPLPEFSGCLGAARHVLRRSATSTSRAPAHYQLSLDPFAAFAKE